MNTHKSRNSNKANFFTPGLLAIAETFVEKLELILDMSKRNLSSLALLPFPILLAAVVSIATLAGAYRHPEADDEMSRLATAMRWKPNSVIADIGAGDGRYSFAAAQHVLSGKVFATEIDPMKLKNLRDELKRRKLGNVVIVEGTATDTNLPRDCCDAIFLRRVYHHLTQPIEFDVALLKPLKPRGRLAIIDFPPNLGLGPVEGLSIDRGGHGILETTVISELTFVGFQLDKKIDDWPQGSYGSYCVLFEKESQQ